MRIIDNFLNGITMYRLVLYLLIFLVILSSIFSYFGFYSYSPQAIIFSSLYILGISLVTNYGFSLIFKVSTNIESVYITALILTLIVSPITEPKGLYLVGSVVVLAIASKYILNISHKHIFNPAAVAVMLTSSASWWVSIGAMALFLVVCALLVVRKIRHEYMYFAFISAVIIIILLFTHASMVTFLLTSPLLFFSAFMLTEPQTSPTSLRHQIIFGLLVGCLFALESPEIALLIGNIYSFLVSSRFKGVLHLQEKINLGLELNDFIFQKPANFNYLPGQYLEWTLPHQKPDSRGNRRFFTLASSPTENTLRLGVKFNTPGSSFKNSLLNLNSSTPISAGQLGGDFVMPKNSAEKLVYIAGGIGITPFRSQIKYLIDKQEHRDIILLYFVKTDSEFVYKDIFSQGAKIGLKTFYEKDRLSPEQIKALIPDYRERKYYLSGPHGLVTGYEKLLADLDISRYQIKKDYFPGY